jgi:hypothetical protein
MYMLFVFLIKKNFFGGTGEFRVSRLLGRHSPLEPLTSHIGLVFLLLLSLSLSLSLSLCEE